MFRDPCAKPDAVPRGTIRPTCELRTEDDGVQLKLRAATLLVRMLPHRQHADGRKEFRRFCRREGIKLTPVEFIAPDDAYAIERDAETGHRTGRSVPAEPDPDALVVPSAWLAQFVCDDETHALER